MKKICFVTTIYTTFSAFLKSFAKYLYETGEYDVSLICNSDEIINNDLPSFIHYYPVDMKRGVSFTAFSAIKKIGEIIEENQFDIVQYSTPNAAFYASIATKKKGTPVRLYCQWGIRYMGFEGWKRNIFKCIEKKICENSTFIEAESHNIRAFSIKEGLYTNSKSSVVWNGSASGVDLKKFDIAQKGKWRKLIRLKYSLKEDDIVFIFAGRLTADKGINELFDAFLSLADIYPQVKLLVAGGMDDESSLKCDLFKKAKESKQIIFLGNVNDIEKYFGASDVFVAPSYREGFGLVVIEAESMGIPAIVSDVPGQIDAIQLGVTGLPCEVKNSESLKRAMIKLIEDNGLRKQLGRNAVKFVEDEFEQMKLFKYLKEHRDELIAIGR